MDDFTVFEDLMESLHYHSDSIMDVWESNLSYTSIRHANNDYEASLGVDAYWYDTTRIPDRAFESVLSEDYEIQIEDTLYIVDLVNEKTYSVNLDNLSDRDTIDISGKSTPGVSCNYGTTTFAYEVQSNGHRVKGKKWNRIYGFYNSFGVQTTNYALDGKGDWKKAKADEIYLWLDHWNTTRWTLRWLAELPPITWEVLSTSSPKRWKMRENAKHVEVVIDFTVGFNPSDPNGVDLCVNEFGRVHHWTLDYYDDAHNNNW